MAIILISQGFVGVSFRHKPSVYAPYRTFAGPTKYMKDSRMNKLLVSISSVLLATLNSAYAFKLDPSSKPDASGLYRKIFFEPIHENLTVKAVNSANIPDSLKSDSAFLSHLIKGVRWNDDPLSMAKKRPQDFYIYYKDSCGRSEEVDPSWDLLYRTHCGDMQFLHAMASKKSESTLNTKELMLMWAEFSYRVAAGDIDKDLHFRSVGKKLGKRSSQLFDYVMTFDGRVRMEWQPETLYTLDCKRNLSVNGFFNSGRPTKLKCKETNNKFSENEIQNIALGSLLHLVQDSFSGSHAAREGNVVGVSKISGAGIITQFGIYSAQDEKSHGKADLNIDDSYGHAELSLTDISAKLIELAINQRHSGSDNWSKAEAILENVFSIKTPDEQPGDIGYGSTTRSRGGAETGR